MKKMRVFELAKELSIETKDLLKIAKDLAISVENNMSMIDGHDAERIQKRVQKDAEEEKKESSAEEKIENKRVSSRVIRRRSKPKADEVETAAEEQKPEAVKEIKKAPKPVEEQPAVEEPKPEIVEEVAAPEPAEVPEIKEPEVVAAPEDQKDDSKKESKKDKKKGKKVVEAVKEDESHHLAAKKKARVKEKEVYTQKDLYADGGRGRRMKKGKDRKLSKAPVKKKKITILSNITVGNLAHEMSVKVTEVIKILMDLGVMANQNQYISAEEAILVANELGIEVEEARDNIKEDFLLTPVYDEKDLAPRPPVVTVMGHVDHGKTSLLDAIRSENVTDGEAGGITQHIGAYQATCNGNLITFIDTPGHEAFTSMRARGAQATDFVVLVVAADDGVMDQTRESINHAKAAGIPIIVAVNKIDRPNANPQRVKEQLSEMGLVPEEWGGETIFVEVSALKRQGLDTLLEMIQLQSEMLEIKACPKGDARGIVLESHLDKNRGAMATMLVQQGEFKRGDVFVVGNKWGKVRAMYDFKNKQIKKAGPATPIELIGLKDMPSSGDLFFRVPNEKKAQEIISYMQDAEDFTQSQQQKAGVSLEDLFNQVQQGEMKELNLIIKGDVHGTVEAIAASVTGIDTGGEINIKVIHSAVGGITENDVLLAATSGAIVCGFNVRPEPKARDLAKQKGIDLKLYSVIYDLIDDIKQALLGLLEPEYEEVTMGRAEVRDTFKVPKLGIIAGCMVTEGKITRGARARLLRDNVVIHDGSVESLRRFKDDAKEVATGYECGIGLGSFNDIKMGDIIEAYDFEEQEIKPAW